MNKKALAIKHHTVEGDQTVTKAEFNEFKTEMYEFRDEMYEFKDAVAVLFDDQRKQLERNIGVMVEEFRSEVRMLADGLKMQIEASERRWNEQNEINNDVKTDINALKLKARFV